MFAKFVSATFGEETGAEAENEVPECMVVRIFL